MGWPLAQVEAPGAVSGTRRRRVAVAVVLIVAVALLAVVVLLDRLDGRYGPVEPGSFGGIVGGTLSYSADGTARLAADPAATARLMSSLTNDGGHSVRVSGIDTDDVVIEVRWSAYRFVPGGAISGVDTPWQRFPAVVPAHGTIRLLFTIHHPASCRNGSVQKGFDDSYRGQHQVHWRSLLGNRTTDFDDGLLQNQIGLC